jgi:hypothetical protein
MGSSLSAVQLASMTCEVMPCVKNHARSSRATPNPSFKPTRYGRQRKPGLRHLVHHLSPGLRCLPTRAA